MRTPIVRVIAATLALSPAVFAQEPVAWGSGRDINFHTFSIVAVDPRTGETGVIVTTRNPCVGNAVPWVRVGVGAVATQGGTRVEYGNDLLNLLEKGVAPQAALDQVVAADEGRENLDAFRAAQDLGTTVPGFVDARVIARLWSRLNEKRLVDLVRRKLLEIQTIR